MALTTQEQIIIMAPIGRDATVMSTLLEAQGYQLEIVNDPADCCRKVSDAGALLLTEEALELPQVTDLIDTLKVQPPWSELPLIVLTSGGESRLAKLLDLLAEAAGSVTLLERPMSAATLLRSVQVALRSRRRQYQVRDLLERQQTLRGQAEEANRIKDEFLATVSHELRTPLNAILGWATLMRQGRMDANTAARAIEAIERNAKAQAQLIEDLLDVSRMISGNLRLNLQRTNLVSVIKAAVDVVHPAADAKNIQLELELEAVEDLEADAHRLQQVVWNLLSNALKFTDAGGTVRIKLERVRSQARIEVSDTGEGIDPKFLPHLFEPFRQADGSSTKRHGGLGLGLAIAHRLVEMHGGTIAAKSEGAGRGATFTLGLPMRIARASDVLPVVTSESSAFNVAGSEMDVPRLAGVKVLTVDDEQDTREMVKGVLEQFGADVLSASSVKEAFAAFHDWNPDVIVCDIGMPGEDGYSLIRKVRQLPSRADRETPAIALTGYVRPEDQQRALAAGYQMFVPKPVEANQLASAIAGVLGPNGRCREPDSAPLLTASGAGSQN
jgi:signal transduction histidine kinase/ActR/RegA family two-component response regulator